MTRGGLSSNGDQYHVVNLSTAGVHTAVSATTNQIVFVAPCACEILNVSLALTTTITTHSSNHWTIALTNQTGDAALLSDNFDTDSDNSGNGGRAITADTLTSLCDNGSGTNYLQNAVLAKGDMILLTATKAASASNLTYPVAVVHWRP